MDVVCAYIYICLCVKFYIYIYDIEIVKCSKFARQTIGSGLLVPVETLSGQADF